MMSEPDKARLRPSRIGDLLAGRLARPVTTHSSHSGGHPKTADEIKPP
jgi:hypothetical protein